MAVELQQKPCTFQVQKESGTVLGGVGTRLGSAAAATVETTRQALNKLPRRPRRTCRARRLDSEATRVEANV